MQLLHNHAQPDIVTATRDAAWTPVPSPEPASLDTDVSVRTDVTFNTDLSGNTEVSGNTDADLIEIDTLIDSIVTDLLINNPII